MSKAEKLEGAARLLREQILRGDYGARGYLPPRAILEQEFGVSHSVMNQVILLLQSEGLITSSRGNLRVAVVSPHTRLPMKGAPLTRCLREQGLEPITEYLEFPERKRMDNDLAKDFAVPEGTLYVARSRRDGTSQTHYRLTTEYFLACLIDDAMLADLQADREYDAALAIENKQAITTTFKTEDIIARLPTPQEQEILGIVRIAPVQELKRLHCDQKGGRVLWIEKIVFVASLFHIHNEYIEDISHKE